VSESQTHDVEKAVVEPEVQEHSQSESQIKEANQEPRPGSHEYNFKEMRRLLEEQQKKIQELTNARSEKQAPHQEEVDELANLRKDDFLTVAQAEKLAQRKAEQLLAEREMAYQEDRMRMKNTDYDSVVTSENIDKLKQEDPELLEAIRYSSNPAAAVYKLIKKASFYEKKVEAPKKKSEDLDKLEKNASKPMSSNAVQSRPIAEMHDFVSSEQSERTQALKEMEYYSKRR
jgi:hypothetical protein